MATSAPPVAPSPSKELLVDDVYPRSCSASPPTDTIWNLVASFVTTATTPFSPRVPENGVGLHVLDRRHGRVLFEKFAEGWGEESSLVVWDPVADLHEEVRLPEAFRLDAFNFTATVLCDTPGCDHLGCHGGYVGHVRLHYASASGAWTASPAAAAAAAVADEDDWGFLETAPATLVGSTLYFRSPGRTLLYQFGDEVEQLAYVDIPPFITQQACGTVLMPAADGRLSFAAMYGGAGAGDMRIQFWETEVHAGGDVDWVHIQNALVKIPVPGVQPIGVAASSLFIRTQDDGIISIDVGSGRFQKLPQPGATQISALVPFMSFGTPSDGGNEKSGSIEVSGPRYADAVPVSDSNNSDDAKEEETASSQILLTS
nr:uncharacterized protein LOC117864749 [Setaria viridis]